MLTKTRVKDLTEEELGRNKNCNRRVQNRRRIMKRNQT